MAAAVPTTIPTTHPFKCHQGVVVFAAPKNPFVPTAWPAPTVVCCASALPISGNIPNAGIIE